MPLHPLKIWRFGMQMDQKEAAAKAKLSPAYISLIETWLRLPSVEAAERLSKLTKGAVSVKAFNSPPPGTPAYEALQRINADIERRTGRA